MKFFVLCLIGLIGCDDDSKPLPLCADVGCPAFALCSSAKGPCSCKQPDGRFEACVMTQPSKLEADIDAGQE